MRNPALKVISGLEIKKLVILYFSFSVRKDRHLPSFSCASSREPNEDVWCEDRVILSDCTYTLIFWVMRLFTGRLLEHWY